MHSFLRQATASQARSIGPFVDDTDFKTAETALTIANTDIKLVINGAASANKNSGGGTHRVNGVFGITFDATDTATVGEIFVSCVMAGALPVFATFVVLEEAVYDALFAASAPGYLQPATAGRTLLVDAAGLADANVVKVGPTGSGTAQTARDIGASVLLSSGTGAGQLSLSSGAVLLQATQTGVTIPTVTNLTNAPTAGDFTATMKTSIGTAVAASAVASVTGNVGGNVTGSVGSVVGAVGSVDGLTASDVGAIKAKTDNLPSDPADESLVIAATDAIMARVGVPAGASVSADIVAMKSDTAAILADTGTTLDGKIDAIKTVTDQLADTLEDQGGGTYGFTEAALQEAPAGGGGGTDWDADERTAIRAILGIPASGTTPDTPTSGILDTLNGKLGAPSNLGGGATLAANLADIEAQTDDIGAAGAGLTALASAANLSTLTGYVDTEVAAIYSRIGAPAGASIAADIAAVKAETATIVDDTGTIGVVVADKTGYRLSAAGVDDVLDEVVEGTTTLRQSVRLANSALGGKASGLETSTAVYRDLADTKDRLSATVDADGNRMAITRDLT